MSLVVASDTISSIKSLDLLLVEKSLSSSSSTINQSKALPFQANPNPKHPKPPNYQHAILNSLHLCPLGFASRLCSTKPNARHGGRLGFSIQKTLARAQRQVLQRMCR